MKIFREVTNKKEWEDFLSACGEKTFLQSWNWGDFQEKMGNKIWRLGLYNKRKELLYVFLVVKIAAKRGKFLLLQHCLSFPEELSDYLKQLAKQEGCSFIRVAPLLAKTEENIKAFKRLGFREAPMHASAYEATLKLDLDLPEEQLLANMRKTTRYLIRQAMKNTDIEVIKSDDVKDINLYQKLNEKVADHQKFTPFSLQFTRKEFEVFAKDNQALLFFSKYKGETAASALVIFWSGIAFYHQAALDPRYHKIPAAYLLQWEVIREAKSRNCKTYDFWGYVNPKKETNHPWSGPTLFKMGFGGKAYQYMETQDLPLSKKYWLTYFFEKARSKKRGL